MYRGSFVLSLLALPVLASTPAPSSAPSAQASGQICHGSPDPSCNSLFDQCVASAQLWSTPACLAAATCAGMEPFLEALCCSTGQCLDPASAPSLDYNLYASVVGSCAWAPGGCPIQPKDYVKFYYDTLLDSGSFELPPVKTVMSWWRDIIAWTATGASSPYTNFNDWLHYSSGPADATQQPSSAQASGGAAAGSDGQGDPTDPTDPSDPTDPTDPTGPTDPATLANSTDPATPPSALSAPASAAGAPPSQPSGPGMLAAMQQQLSGGGAPPQHEHAHFGGHVHGDGSDDDFMQSLFAAMQGNASAPSPSSAQAAGGLERRTASSSAAAPPATPTYELPCGSGKYPAVCENWCYYVFCKKGQSGVNAAAWTVTVNRKANLRGASACKTPNKCSSKEKGTGGWTKNPKTDLSCDEQPKNTNDEGGANAATRCVPKGENSGEGSTWSNFINKKDATIADGTKVKVVLKDPPSGGICAPLHGGAKTCPAAKTPSDDDVKKGTDDGTRQA